MPTTKANPQDALSREKLMKALLSNIEAVARLPSGLLATPRVISVSAEWGNGKTWVATELEGTLRRDQDRRVVSIDAFRFDHHDDPFAVIASAMYRELKPEKQRKAALLKAAGAVLKSAAPIAAKAALTAGARAIGLTTEDTSALAKSVSEGVSEQAGKLSEKAMEALFDAYSNKQETQDAFIAALNALTEALDKPLVVIIDELDRCRPSFALEVLERLKHIFNAENVVFVLFWNPNSIHESIKHTYGFGTDAERYLSKFVALDLPLIPARRRVPGEQYDEFIRTLMEAHAGPEANSFDFRDSLRTAAMVFQPSLRDIQKTIQTWAQTEWHKADQWAEVSAYLLLLKTISSSRFELLRRQDATAAAAEVKRMEEALTYHANEPMYAPHAILAYLADRVRLNSIMQQLRADPKASPSARDGEILSRTDNGTAVRFFDAIAQGLAQPMR